jgi:hypothetical protein
MSEEDFENFILRCENIFNQKNNSTESLESFSKCKHDNCWNEICINCGEEQQGMIDYTKFFESKDVSIRKSDLNTKDYIKDICIYLDKLDIDTATQSKIFDMYFRIGHMNVYRSKLTRAIICACTLTICNAIERPKDEKHLCKVFNITKKDQSKGLKLVKLYIKESRLIVYGIKEYIIIFIDLLQNKIPILNNNINNICCFATSIKEQYKNPKIVAAATIYIWLCKNSDLLTSPISMTAFAQMCQIQLYIFVQTVKLINLEKMKF